MGSLFNPSLGFLSIARECNGISGLDHASCPGDKSSVLISPGTLKTVNFISSGNFGLLVNQDAFDQLSITFFA